MNMCNLINCSFSFPLLLLLIILFYCKKWWISDSNNIQKEPEECRETSQAKRRRMLQFNNQDRDPSLSNMEMSSACFKNVSACTFFFQGYLFTLIACWMIPTI